MLSESSLITVLAPLRAFIYSVESSFARLWQPVAPWDVGAAQPAAPWESWVWQRVATQCVAPWEGRAWELAAPSKVGACHIVATWRPGVGQLGAAWEGRAGQLVEPWTGRAWQPLATSGNLATWRGATCRPLGWRGLTICGQSVATWRRRTPSCDHCNQQINTKNVMYTPPAAAALPS